MKFSLVIIPALSATVLAAPTPILGLFDKSCAQKKPYTQYPEDYKGCLSYNADELKYKLKCIWYQPKLKVCKPDNKQPVKVINEEDKKKEEVSALLVPNT